jgi:hypothetical protein
MNKRRRSKQSRLDANMRMLNRLILGGVAVFVPLYLIVRFTGGEAKKIENIAQVFSHIKEPIVWSVPERGVQYLTYFQGAPDEGNKFVLIEVQMKARMRIGFPVLPRCFRLVDDLNIRHYPRSHSPFFIAYSDSFYMDRDEEFSGKLLFEIPADRKAENLLFDRYKE